MRERSPEASDARQLLPLVYDELRRLASHKLAKENPGHSFQATALVHEAYLRLVGDGDPGWDNQGHFFAAAAKAMRRILIDNARSRAALKNGGYSQRVQFDERLSIAESIDDDLLALDEALSELEVHDPQAARLVMLRYFSGLTHQQAAESMGITRRAADRLWAVAKAWLFQRMQSG